MMQNLLLEEGGLVQVESVNLLAYNEDNVVEHLQQEAHVSWAFRFL